MTDLINRIDFTQHQQGWVYQTIQTRASCGAYIPLDLTDASVSFYVAEKDMSARMWETDCEIIDTTGGRVRFWVPDTAFDGIAWANPEEKSKEYFCRFWVDYWAVPAMRIPVSFDGGWAKIFRDLVDIT